jgi:hypothetical protein
MIFLPLVPWLCMAELAIATSLAAAMLPAATYGVFVPPRLQPVDGRRATEEYARENGLDEYHR